MSSRDNALFAVPRTSRFALLISDDEDDSCATNTEAVANNITETPMGEPVAKASEEPKTNRHDAADAADWSCATARKGSSGKKGHKSLSSGPRPANSAPHHTHNGQHPFRKTSYIPPVTLDQLSPELTLEIYNFPVAWRTSDIRKLLNPFDGYYRLKWQNDTSCWIHFDSAGFAHQALSELQTDEASLRVFSPENIIAPPTQPEAIPSYETTLEVYGFPPAWNASDLGKVLENWLGKYRLKWRTEASCWVIFESAELVQQAFDRLSEETVFKTRHYAANP